MRTRLRLVRSTPLEQAKCLADIESQGSRSAVCGGTTTIIVFAPQTKEEDTLLDTLEATHAKARGKCYSDYSFHIIVANPSEKALSEFPALREKGISSLKVSR